MKKCSDLEGIEFRKEWGDHFYLFGIVYVPFERDLQIKRSSLAKRSVAKVKLLGISGTLLNLVNNFQQSR